jgi:hypothetical protein
MCYPVNTIAFTACYTLRTKKKKKKKGKKEVSDEIDKEG